MNAPLLSRPPASPLERLVRVHWPVVGLLGALALIGVASLYSVAGGSMTPWAERHALRFLAALAMLIAIAVTPLRLWTNLAYPAYAMALAALALVPVIGVEAMGARRWIGLGGLSFQPSELMKLALVLALARYYQWLPGEKASSPLFVAIPLALIAVPVALTLKQPDLGTAALFAVTGLGLMFLAGVSVLYFLAGAAAFGALAPAIWGSLHDYQRRRIEVFLDPDRDPLGAGYHIAQSKIALGSGGLTGRGWGQGTQATLDFLPEKHTDFVFTMLAEEWGFAGAATVLGLYGLLIALIAGMAFACRSRFARLVIAGAALTLFIYVFINIAMVTGLVPVVGVPLPLISFGGSAMATQMAAIGLALSAGVNAGDRFRPNELGRLH